MRAAVSTALIFASLLAVAVQGAWGSWEWREQEINKNEKLTQEEFWEMKKETNDIERKEKERIGGMEQESNREEENNYLEMMETYNDDNETTTSMSNPTVTSSVSSPTVTDSVSSPTVTSSVSSPTVTSSVSSPKVTSSVSNPTVTSSVPDLVSTSSTTSLATTVKPTTSTTPTTTKKPNTDTTKVCLNGGTPDGNNCICSGNFDGPQCEFGGNKVDMGDKLNATVDVTMKITNKEFHSTMENKSSPAYKEFEEEFKAEMKMLYINIRNYKDLIIHSLSKGSIIVNHSIVLEMDYNSEVNVTEDYKELFDKVQDQLLSSNCSNGNDGLCFQEPEIIKVPVPNEEELCMNFIAPGYSNFYTPTLTSKGLICLSHCDEDSPVYQSCNSGDCKLEKTGPECYCPKTDIYIYSSSKCKGRILKAGLYGGVGAGIAVFAIVILTVGILLHKAKQPMKRKDPFSKDQERKWYEDNDDDEWGVTQGFKNMRSEQGENDTSKNGKNNKENFKPALENVDTRIAVKIQRPQVARR